MAEMRCTSGAKALTIARLDVRVKTLTYLQGLK